MALRLLRGRAEDVRSEALIKVNNLVDLVRDEISGRNRRRWLDDIELMLTRASASLKTLPESEPWGAETRETLQRAGQMIAKGLEELARTDAQLEGYHIDD